MAVVSHAHFMHICVLILWWERVFVLEQKPTQIFIDAVHEILLFTSRKHRNMFSASAACLCHTGEPAFIAHTKNGEPTSLEASSRIKGKKKDNEDRASLSQCHVTLTIKLEINFYNYMPCPSHHKHGLELWSKLCFKFPQSYECALTTIVFDKVGVILQVNLNMEFGQSEYCQ